MRREISQEEWGAEKLRDPDSNFDQDPLEWELPNSVIFHLMQNSEDMGLAAYVLERFLQMSLQQEAAVGSGSKAAFASVDVISRRPAKS
jgi:hypothetical protein